MNNRALLAVLGVLLVISFGLALWQASVAGQRGIELTAAHAARTQQADAMSTQSAEVALAATANADALIGAATQAADSQSTAIAEEQAIAESNLRDTINAAATAQEAALRAAATAQQIALSTQSEDAASTQSALQSDFVNAATAAAATQAVLQGNLDADATLIAGAPPTLDAANTRAAATANALRQDARTAVAEAEETIVAQSTALFEASTGGSLDGWVRVQGNQVSILLPERYIAGEAADLLDNIDDYDNAPDNFEDTLSNMADSDTVVLVGYDFPESRRDSYISLVIAAQEFETTESMRSLVRQFEDVFAEDLEVTDTDVLNVNGEEVGMLITVAEYNNPETTAVTYVFVRNGWLYLIWFTTESSNFDDYLPEFDTSMRSFQAERGNF